MYQAGGGRAITRRVTDNQKTLAAAAILAAAVGVYLEMQRHEALRAGGAGARGAASASATPHATKPGVE